MAMAIKTLKDQNVLRLVVVVLANILTLYVMATGHSFANADWAEARKAVGKIIPAGLAAVIIGVLNAQLDATTKARIVFLRWRHPLPGSQAFSKHGPDDPRIDMEAVKRKLGELPTDPGRQNAAWYGLYREVADMPSVLHANKEYLFTRDYHIFSLGILIVFGAASGWLIAEPVTRVLYAGGLLLQAIITGQAARNHGRRLVCNVLALTKAPAPLPRKGRHTKKSSGP